LPHSLNKEKSHDMTSDKRKKWSTWGLLSRYYMTQALSPGAHPKFHLRLYIIEEDQRRGGLVAEDSSISLIPYCPTHKDG
jgi:hypothetical protein